MHDSARAQALSLTALARNRVGFSNRHESTSCGVRDALGVGGEWQAKSRPNTESSGPPCRRRSTACSTMQRGRRWRRCRPGEWASYNPNRGDTMPDDFRTEVRVAYDDRNIYFAFHCFDNEPDRSAPRSRAAIARSTTTGWRSASTPPPPARAPITSSPIRAAARWMRSTPPHRASSSMPTWCGTAPERPVADGYVLEVQIPLQSLRFAEATMCAWGWCSSARSAASATPMRGRRCCPANGCSIGRRI